MKIRTSFVTNSSSSSYVITVNKERLTNLTKQDRAKMQQKIYETLKNSDWIWVQGNKKKVAKKLVDYLTNRMCNEDALYPKCVFYNSKNEIVLNVTDETSSPVGDLRAYLSEALEDLEEYGIYSCNIAEDGDECYVYDLIDKKGIVLSPLCHSCIHGLERLISGKCNGSYEPKKRRKS